MAQSVRISNFSCNFLLRKRNTSKMLSLASFVYLFFPMLLKRFRSCYSWVKRFQGVLASSFSSVFWREEIHLPAIKYLLGVKSGDDGSFCDKQWLFWWLSLHILVSTWLCSPGHDAKTRNAFSDWFSNWSNFSLLIKSNILTACMHSSRRNNIPMHVELKLVLPKCISLPYIDAIYP